MAAPGQVLDGTYNPFLRQGYMTPTNDQPVTVTLDQTQNAHMSASIYDAVNNDFYFAENATQIFKGDTTADTTLARVVSITGATSIGDLEIYMVNGVRKLFVMYNNASGDADIAISNLPYDSGTDDLTWLTATVSGSTLR